MDCNHLETRLNSEVLSYSKIKKATVKRLFKPLRLELILLASMWCTNPMEGMEIIVNHTLPDLLIISCGLSDYVKTYLECRVMWSGDGGNGDYGTITLVLNLARTSRIDLSLEGGDKL